MRNMSYGTVGREGENQPSGGSLGSDSDSDQTSVRGSGPILGSEASGISRRDFLFYSAASAAVVLAGRPLAGAEGNSALKVGLILPEEGPLAPEAKSLISGFEFCLKEKGADASRLEVHRKDSGADDSKTLEAVAELVVNLKVQFLVAPLSLEGSVKAVQSLAGANPILFITNPCVRFVGGEMCLPTAFRVRPNSYQASRPLGPWALRNAGMKVFLMGDDDEQGNEETDFFTHGFEKAGGVFLDRKMVPPGSEEMETVLATAVKAEPDFIFAAFRGDSAAAFLKALRNATPAIKQPVIGPESLTAFPRIVMAAGKECAGIRTLTAFQNPPQFTTEIKAKLQSDVADASRAAEGYDIATIISNVAGQIRGEADSDKIVDFIKGMEIDGPRGKIKFDANHEPIISMMVQEWVPEGQSMNQKILENLGETRSLDFGCGRVGFPQRPEEESEAEKSGDSKDVDAIWDEDNQ